MDFMGLWKFKKLQAIHNSNEKLFSAIVRDTRLLVYDEAHKASATENKKYY